jgi:hypothetical protein
MPDGMLLDAGVQPERTLRSLRLARSLAACEPSALRIVQGVRRSRCSLMAGPESTIPTTSGSLRPAT